MATQTLTLRAPKQLLKVERVATERGTSVTALVLESLTRITSGNEAYNAAWERQQALMRSGQKLRHEGEAFPSRKTLHER